MFWVSKFYSWARVFIILDFPAKSDNNKLLRHFFAGDVSNAASASKPEFIASKKTFDS
jgi:hypothetical protein